MAAVSTGRVVVDYRIRVCDENENAAAPAASSSEIITASSCNNEARTAATPSSSSGRGQGQLLQRAIMAEHRRRMSCTAVRTVGCVDPSALEKRSDEEAVTVAASEEATSSTPKQKMIEPMSCTVGTVVSVNPSALQKAVAVAASEEATSKTPEQRINRSRIAETGNTGNTGRTIIPLEFKVRDDTPGSTENRLAVCRRSVQADNAERIEKRTRV